MRFLDTSRIRTRFDERLLGKDGTELSVDMYLPPEPGHYPVLLNRTAADNNRVGRPGISMPPAERWKAFAAQGFIVAAADVRGRGDSNGTFVPFVHEGDDGAATVAWLRGLEECNGKVGTFGWGYGAFCAWAAAVAEGHVDAVASVSPFGRVGDGLVHRFGAVRLDWLFWMHLIGGRTVQPANAPPWKVIYRHAPLRTMDATLGREDIWWQEWLDHLDPEDSYWAPLDLAEKISELEVPGLHVTGWWDGQVAGARYYYEAACRSGVPQQLIIGPWDTAATRRPVAQVGGFDFGPRSALDLDETLAEFFDTTLRRDRAPEASRIFVTGRNEWQSGKAWRTSSGNVLNLYLSSSLGANTRRGDGTLSRLPPAFKRVDCVTHNPSVPVDFQPQFVSFATGANALEFTLDQAHVTARDEALVYTSAPVESPVTVIGRPKLVLSARIMAPDADLYVLLSDSFPLGIRDLHLAHGAVRLATLKEFRLGELVTLEFELDGVAHDFLAGHAIRLTVTPSLYPLYARNLHVQEYALDREPSIADIEILSGPGAPALLSLPLAETCAMQ
jgi:putative CocE/NonD family hydrolase